MIELVLTLVIFHKNWIYSSFCVKGLLEHTIFYSLEYLLFKCIKIINNKHFHKFCVRKIFVFQIGLQVSCILLPKWGIM